MTTETLFHGLQDIIAGRIAHEAIIDMAPYIRAHMPIIRIHEKYVPVLGNDYIYIAGQVTGMPYEEAEDKFLQAEHALRMAGFKTINPMRIVPKSASWEIAMCICITAMVQHCNKIYLLDNWSGSNGATIEKLIADDLLFTNIEISTLLKTAI